MNKIKNGLIALTLLCTLHTFANAQLTTDEEIIIKIGFQPQCILSDSNKDLNMELGGSIGLEYFKYLGNIVAFGIGSIYDLSRKIQSKDYNGSLAFLPLFIGTKIRTPLQGTNNNYAFLSARIGYSVPMAKDMPWKAVKGEAYYGFGLGVSINSLVFEAVYDINNFKYKETLEEANKKSSCSTITLYAGLKFE
jgi:hypothetical protein